MTIPAADSPPVSTEAEKEQPRIFVINAGTSEPSSSRMLAERVAQKTIDQLSTRGIFATVKIVELGPLAGEIAHAIVSGFPHGDLLAAVRDLASADGIIVATPVYKAGISGLLKSFIDILDNDLLIATPVILTATAGSARHALVIDDQLRPLFAYLRALPVPTSLFAAPEDWGDPSLAKRTERAAGELSVMIASGIREAIATGGWDRYQHNWGGNTRPAAGPSVDFNTDLMKLAVGGSFAKSA